MADLVNIRMEGDRVLVEGDRLFNLKEAEKLVRDAIDDIADAVEDEAKRQAPLGETGALKLHPVDRDVGVGTVTGIAAFGGGLTVRGEGGRFVAATNEGEVGQMIARAELSIAKDPEYAIWVHDGTGIYGPKKKPYHAIPPNKYMTFYYPKAFRANKHFRLKTVLGQQAQPFLRDAYLLIEKTYIPARIELLRARLAAET